MLKIEPSAIIKDYENGHSMNSIAKTYGTYTITVKRLLEKYGVKLRHDNTKDHKLYVKGGEKLIEWAKTQGRLVTKTELAAVIGKKKLSPSYFIKYPELGQYIAPYEQTELSEYSKKLYAWLRKNDIPYKPNDRTKIKLSVTAWLLNEYSNILLQIAIKPKCVSTKKFSEDMIARKNRAHKIGMTIIFLNEEHFNSLDETLGSALACLIGE